MQIWPLSRGGIAASTDLPDRLHGTHLVIDMHHTDQNGIRPQGSFQIRYSQYALLIHIQVCHLVALVLHRPAGV